MGTDRNKNILKNAVFSASMTVEAALVLPIFIFAITTFLYLFQFIFLQQGIQTALNQTAGYFAKNAYLYGQIADNFSEVGNEELSKVCEVLQVRETVSSFIYEEKFQQTIGDTLSNFVVIKGGREGISIRTRADYFEDGITDLCAYYTCRIPVLFFPLDSFECSQRVKSRNWVGEDAVCKYGQDAATEDSSDQPAAQEVYMTKYGTKYHTHLDCTHLKLSIKEKTYAEVLCLRNSEHGKYTACQICARNVVLQPGSIVYITDEGEHYHTSRNCGGLKRYINTISFDQIPSGTACCKRCEKRDHPPSNTGE